MTPKKKHKNYSHFNQKKNHVLQFGFFGLKTTQYFCLTQAQLNTLVWLIKFKLKKVANKNNAKLWVSAAPNLTLTKLGAEARMGKGKGTFYAKALFLKPGNILFEFDNITKPQLCKLFHFIAKKSFASFQIISRFD
uniref:Ribosomal protein L16 n=1 Tax=Ceramothamnion japonicum TaxID=218448 RepID=A0A0E3DBR1_CERJP|nr:ribosomal protein L16 [Ceramium japonicum]